MMNVQTLKLAYLELVEIHAIVEKTVFVTYKGISQFAVAKKAMKEIRIQDV